MRMLLARLPVESMPVVFGIARSEGAERVLPLT